MSIQLQFTFENTASLKILVFAYIILTFAASHKIYECKYLNNLEGMNA
jgi:hypothetical protein